MSDFINDRGLDVELCALIGGGDGDGRDLGEVENPSTLAPTEAPEAEHVRGLRSAFCGGFNPADADALASEHLDPETILIAAEEDDIEAAACALRADPADTAWRSYPRAQIHRAA